MAGWFDSHTHLDFWRIEQVPGVLNDARAAGIEKVLTVGRTVISSSANVWIANRAETNGMVVAGVGIHPNWPEPLDDAAYKHLKELTKDDKVVAIAETGIGWGRAPETRDDQRIKLARHIQRAREVGLPVVMHSDRQAGPDIAEIYEQEKGAEVGGVMHSTMVDVDAARRIWEMGVFISIGFQINKEDYEYLEEVAREVPEDLLIIETDSAGGLGGGTPDKLIDVAEKVASVRGISMDHLREVNTRNINKLLHL